MSTRTDIPEKAVEAAHDAWLDARYKQHENGVAAMRAALSAASPFTGAVVKPLEWEPVLAARSKEDPTPEETGEYETVCAVGVYYIEMYFGSDSYGWCVTLNGADDIADKDDPDDAKAAAQADYEARIRSALVPSPVPQEALPLDRDTLGRMVREAWVRWAMTQPSPKPSWLLPYDELAEPDKEADRQIGEAIAKWTVIHYEARAALAPVPQEAPAEPVAWPSGFFVIGGDARLRDCATEGCGQHVSIRIERDGVGSECCEPCARKIATLYARPVPAAEPAPARVAEPVASEAIAKLIEHHRLDCSRMVHGQCSTRRCLVRGGWEAGDGSGYSKATCEALETCRALEALERAAPPARQDALREALLDAAAHLRGAASAYREHAARHRIVGRAKPDPFFTTRVIDFAKAADRAAAAIAPVPATEAREGE